MWPPGQPLGLGPGTLGRVKLVESSPPYPEGTRGAFSPRGLELRAVLCLTMYQ